MGLTQLAATIGGAIQRMKDASIIDEKVVKICVNDIALALFEADVPFNLVRRMQTNIINNVLLHSDDFLAATAHDKGQIILQAIYDEMYKIFDTGKPSFAPKKGEKCVVMFIGLQESGKSVACAQYANYHEKKGWQPAIVYADTFRATTFDHLMQNTMGAGIPLYGSFMESDPVNIAVEGVETFRKEDSSDLSSDLIIVHTSEGHTQEDSLFEEIHQVYEATKPDLVIFVIDSSIGQAAFDQAQAFKQNFGVGAVILTKMDGHAKGAGALTSVAATKIPVILSERGEDLVEFEAFDTKHFVSRLLGLGNSFGLMEHTPVDQQPKLLPRGYHLRFIYEFLKRTVPFACSGQSVDCLLAKWDNESIVKSKRYKTMMDAMTNEELDSHDPRIFNCSSIVRIAKGSGCNVREVLKLLEQQKLGVRKLKHLKKRASRMTSTPANQNWVRELSNMTIIH